MHQLELFPPDALAPDLVTLFLQHAPTELAEALRSAMPRSPLPSVASNENTLLSPYCRQSLSKQIAALLTNELQLARLLEAHHSGQLDLFRDPAAPETVSIGGPARPLGRYARSQWSSDLSSPCTPTEH